MQEKVRVPPYFEHDVPGKTKIKITAAQTDALCTFFEENPEVIRGYTKKPYLMDMVQAKWRQISLKLNTLGPQKGCKAWAKYLCDMKAKLKRKRIKWRQNSDGTGPIICNANDFSEIKLRMIQVLRKDISSEQDTQSTDLDKQDSEDDTVINDAGTRESTHMDCSKFTEACINISDDDNLVDSLHQAYPSDGDEFETFGKNVAKQLRVMPLELALETQEMLLSVLRKQRVKDIYKKTNKKDMIALDPLFI